jgi:hypothetical protein
MKSFIQKTTYIVAFGALVFLGTYFAGAQGSGATLPNGDYELYGYACNFIPPSGANPPIGCISLNRLSSLSESAFTGQPTAAWRATFNPAAGTLGGKGWNPIIGEVEFGVTCPSSVAITGAQNGKKCAKITDIFGNSNAGAWDGYIYTGSVTYKPSTSGAPTGLMSGVAWGANNVDGATAPYSPDIGVGRIDFSQYAFVHIPGCMDPSKTNYNPYATVQDSSCSSTIEICTDVIDNNNDNLGPGGTDLINEGCPEICTDGLDNDQNGQIDDGCSTNTDPCTDTIDNDGDGLIDSADSSECSGVGGGGGTGSGLKPKYREQ